MTADETMKARLTLLPEDADERRMFDRNVETLGHPLAVVANALTIMSATAPPQGSYSKMLAIYANECDKAVAALSEAVAAERNACEAIAKAIVNDRVNRPILPTDAGRRELCEKLRPLLKLEARGSSVFALREGLAQALEALSQSEPAGQGGGVLSKEWCLAAATREGDSEVGAGLLAADPPAIPSGRNATDYGDGYAAGLAAGEAHRHAIERTNVALCADVARKDAALVPFAGDELCRAIAGNIEGDHSVVFQRNDARLTLGDFRRAKAALSTSAADVPEVSEGWRPIETAPKDRMFIWAAPKGDGKWGLGLAYRNVSGGWSDAYGGDAPAHATKWHELPDPPRRCAPQPGQEVS